MLVLRGFAGLSLLHWTHLTGNSCVTLEGRCGEMDDDLLDNIYFALPVLWDHALEKAQALDISHKTLINGLRKLMAEGLVICPRRGYYIENLEVTGNGFGTTGI